MARRSSRRQSARTRSWTWPATGRPARVAGADHGNDEGGRGHGGNDQGARDQGMVSAFVVIFATALVFVAGLVVDGGRMLAEHRKIDNLADSAARAGAQAISQDAVYAGETVNVLDEARAVDLACAFLANAGNGCGGGTTVTVAGGEVTVTVVGSVDLLLLAGGARPVRGEGSACVAVGIASAAC